jgi:hypothetical protein
VEGAQLVKIYRSRVVGEPQSRFYGIHRSSHRTLPSRPVRLMYEYTNT